MAYTLITTLLLLISAITSSTATGTIGVNYGRIANNLPDPTKVVQLLKQNSINHIKIFDTDSTVLKALSGSKITVTVCLPNEQLKSAAADHDD
ncbi:putative glucan endo-1,3-beta-D-glucosidase [Helianthus annuus]|nr:putative glucan endo-1,3-beta-D-glucosidase [Helianthus annuus]